MTYHNLFIFWSALAVFLLSGLSFLLLTFRAFRVKNSYPFYTKIALSFGLGLGVNYVSMQFLSFLGFSWNKINILVLPISLIIITAKWHWQEWIKKLLHWLQNPKLKRNNIISLVFPIVLLFCFVLTLELNSLQPFTAFDSFAIWGLKANLFYYARGIDFNGIPTWLLNTSHSDYPILLPLTYDSIFLLLGKNNEIIAKLILPFFSLATISILYYSLRQEKLGKTISQFFTLGLFLTPLFLVFSIFGYADLPFAYYVFTSIIFLRDFHRKTQPVSFFLSLLFACLATTTKNEGLPFLLFILSTLWLLNMSAHKSTHQKDLTFSKTLLISLTLIVSLVLPWQIYKILHHYHSDIVNSQSLKLVQKEYQLLRNPTSFFDNSQFINYRLPTIVGNWFKYFFFYFHYYTFIFWIFFLILFSLGWHRAKQKEPILLLSIFFFLSLYSIIYLITPKNLIWHIKTSMPRLIIHILPLTFFITPLLIKESRTKKKL